MPDASAGGRYDPGRIRLSALVLMRVNASN
jgi:hypothetical protein